MAPRLGDEGGEVLCTDLDGTESGSVVAVSLVLGESLGSEAVGDEGVTVGVAEVDAYEHECSFCGVDGGFWLRLWFGRRGAVVVCWGPEDVVGTEFIDACLAYLVLGGDFVRVGLVAGALVADDDDVSTSPGIGWADDNITGLHGVP